MSKTAKIVIGIVVVSIVAYVAYTYYKNKQTTTALGPVGVATAIA